MFLESMGDQFTGKYTPPPARSPFQEIEGLEEILQKEEQEANSDYGDNDKYTELDNQTELMTSEQY